MVGTYVPVNKFHTTEQRQQGSTAKICKKKKKKFKKFHRRDKSLKKSSNLLSLHSLLKNAV